MSNYVTLAQLKAFRPPGSTAALDFSNFTDAELQDILDYVEELFEEELHDKFYSFDQTLYADGTGKTHLFLPQHAAFPYKIISISSMEEVDFDGTTVLTTYVEDDDFKFDDYYVYTDVSNSPTVRQAIGSQMHFPKGEANIKISGTFGWSTTPKAIERATKLYAVVLTLGPQKAGFFAENGGLNVRQQQWTDYMVTFGAAPAATMRANAGVPNITGYLDIDRMLRNYVNHSMLFQAIDSKTIPTEDEYYESRR